MKAVLMNYARLLSLTVILFISCEKEMDQAGNKEELVSSALKASHGHLKQTKTYSSEVVQKWLRLQNQILLQQQETNTGFGFLIARFYAALGISAYESVVPGMPAYQSLSGQLLEMPAMPQTEPGLAYHWPASANAALAQTFKRFLPNTSFANKASIDSLENALNLLYQTEVTAATFQRSRNFGTEVAIRIFDWSRTDGFFTTYPPYVPPAGPGLWQPTPPGFAAASGPYWGNIRPLVPGTLTESAPPPPIPYSTNPSSEFFASMQEVYNTRQLLISNPALKAQVQYWRGSMGGSGFIMWYNILRKILSDQGVNAMLDKAALAYAQLGIVHKDASIAASKAKFFYNQLVPITYIRGVMAQTTWNSEIPAPASPGYPELHAPQYSSSAAVLTKLFGSNYSFNTDGVSPLGLPGYTFSSFAEAGVHANQSRFYAGLGTQSAVDAGAGIGNKTAMHMTNTIKFLK